MSRWFEAPLTTLAFCWRLDRQDGVTMGFTSHDRDLQFQGLHYRAAPGMVPSAIERTAGLEADSVQLNGALTNSALRAADLEAGCWDGAALRLWAVDWTSPNADAVLLVRGRLGAVDIADGAFSVELTGATAELDRPVTATTSPHCRAQLGDERCRVNLAGRTMLATVTALSGNRATIDQSLGANRFIMGRLRWAGGPRAGLRDYIVTHDDHVVTLADAPTFTLSGPVTVEVIEGCDRSFSTCRTRFSNSENFRGEPHLPGNDVLMRYGG